MRGPCVPQDRRMPGRGGAHRPRGRRRFRADLLREAPAMPTPAMGKLLESYLTELEGEKGFWRGNREDVPVFVFSDDEHDRMRLMAPIRVGAGLDTQTPHR